MQRKIIVLLGRGRKYAVLRVFSEQWPLYKWNVTFIYLFAYQKALLLFFVNRKILWKVVIATTELVAVNFSFKYYDWKSSIFIKYFL